MSDSQNGELPMVTVLGGGIAGLTVAHELVERGFPVQVVEERVSTLEEYCCDVGGLAANQFARVRAPLEAVHGKRRLAQLSQADWNSLRQFRVCNGIERTNRRYPLLQSI